jgi:hypothetical protein
MHVGLPVLSSYFCPVLTELKFSGLILIKPPKNSRIFAQ